MLKMRLARKTERSIRLNIPDSDNITPSIEIMILKYVAILDPPSLTGLEPGQWRKKKI